MSKDKIIVENLTKSFSSKLVLDDVSFTVKDGEFLSILGPSGCGKSTILRILIGLEGLTKGKIYKDGEDITNFKTSKRNMGIVFQNYALFENMTVLENVEYALRIKKHTKHIARDVALSFLEKVNLTEHLDKKPNKLSGGQQQRVAIARTLATNPDILLFDEPMSALDVDARLALRQEIKEIQRDLGTTTIYITHDQEEAFVLSDRILVMDTGVIKQIDTPKNILNNPADSYVEDFVVKNLQLKISELSEFIKVANHEN